MKKLLIVLLFALAPISIFLGQQLNNNGVITGKVFDEQTKKPIEYSNVILFTEANKNQITGAVTNKNGEFSLTGIKAGKYYVYVQFVGYERKEVNGITISTSKPKVNLGSIYLKPAAINLKNVVVKGKRPAVSYQIDKKVIDVSQLSTTISGNATDVLENIPSVNVDIDGNVTLRGSSNFTVLIDGRPSVMDAQDALQQIPATAIKSIEVITNPSAKYDAEGTAGIINIILKKNQNLGLSGIVNLNAGLNDKYGGNFIFQYKTPSINYNLGIDYNRRRFPGSNNSRKRFIINNNTSFLNSNGDMAWGRKSFDVRGGMDFNIGDLDNLSFGGRYGWRDHLRNATLNYIQWSTTDPTQSFYLSNSNRSRSGSFYAFNTNYQHKFGTDGHNISGEFFLSHDNSNESTVTSQIQAGSQSDGKNTTELGPSTRMRGKIDYVLPFADSSKFSAGTQFRSELSKDVNKLYEYDTTNNNYNFQPQFSNSTDYTRSRMAIYSIYSDKFGNLGIQGGVRGEYTYQKVKLEETNQQFSINRWDFFPSIHSSYRFSDGSQIMASYTRRIERPRGWQLEPFYTWLDANTVRIGDPSLKPEYIDSYELGFQTNISIISFSNDFYYRSTRNRIDHVNSVYSDNVTLNTFQNVGTDYSLGAEYMITFNPIKLWEFNLMGELYDYRIKGAISNEAFSNESFNWNMKSRNTFKITPSTQFQLNVRYYSPSVSPQGKWEGYFTTDVALKQDLLSKKLSLTLQVRDLLRTGRWEFTSQGSDFYTYNHFTREAPRVMLNLRYNFNNYNEKQQQQGNGNQQDNGQDEGGYN